MTDRIAFAGSVTADGRRIRGSVPFAGQRGMRDGEWLEIDPAAVVKADAKDVFARIDHDPSKPFARTTNNSLTVQRTDQGIEWFTEELPDIPAANEALAIARAGLFGGSSFQIEGMRSKFDTAADGRRVRRITSIQRLTDVSPVYDPFFKSSVAAFNKEKDDVTDVIETPAPEAKGPPPTPQAATFSEQPKSGKDTWAAFAKEYTTEQITGQMDAIFAESKGTMTGELLDRYEGFASELQNRKQDEAETKARIERMETLHNLRLGRVPKAPSNEAFASQDYQEAFKKYLKSTPQSFGANTATMESFAQTIAGDGTQGGFTVPDGFVNKITERLKAFGGIASLAEEIVTSTGESLRWPTIDDTDNEAQIVAEDTQATQGADLVFGNVELGAFEYDATGANGNPIEVSLSLLQDSAFDMEKLLTKLLGKRIGRKQAKNWATGMGGTEPVGLLSKAADVMSATVASLAAVEHVFQVDSEYRDSGNCYWVMSDTSLAKVWGAQSTTNEPLFMPNRVINGKPFDTLMGYPIKIDPAAGNLVAFGDIEAGYIIRRVRGIQLLVDPYSAQKRRAVQYHAWARADGNIQDPNAYSVSDWTGVSADT